MSASGVNAVGLELERSQAYRQPSQARKQLTRFLFVGGSSVAVDLVCYTFLLGRLDRVSAKGIAYAVGVLVGFAGNKLWTFESRRKSYTEPAIYVFIYGITLVLNMAINSLVCDIVTPWIRSDTTTQCLAFLIATGVTTVLNFLGLKYFAFRQSQIQSA